jgi:hypothetical protein
MGTTRLFVNPTAKSIFRTPYVRDNACGSDAGCSDKYIKVEGVFRTSQLAHCNAKITIYEALYTIPLMTCTTLLRHRPHGKHKSRFNLVTTLHSLRNRRAFFGASQDLRVPNAYAQLRLSSALAQLGLAARQETRMLLEYVSRLFCAMRA